jgi:CRP-like cAMP-binding protein
MTPKNEGATFDPKEFLSRIGDGRTNIKFAADDVVFAQGDAADAVYYLQNGKAKITVTSENGKEAVLAIIGPGDFFGEGCMNGQARRMATVTAITECSIMRLEKAAMMRVLHAEPKFSDLFIGHLLHRNSRVEADLVDQLFNSSEKRLARMLLLLANFGKDAKQEPVIAKISQETLAEMIGTTRSRVNFFMNKFRRLGFVDYNGDMHGNLRVHTSLLNMVLREGISDEPPETPPKK